MTLRQFLNYGVGIKDELLDIEITLIAPNGLEVTPVLKFVRKNEGNLSTTEDTIDRCIITYD